MQWRELPHGWLLLLQCTATSSSVCAASHGYAAHMLHLYEWVTAHGWPNFVAETCLDLPSNFVFEEWDKLVYRPEGMQMVDFLCFSFPMGYKIPVPMPAMANHPSANNQFRDLAIYITKN